MERKEINICQVHCGAGVHHYQTVITDWRRAWETSKVEPIPLEPVDRLTITCLIDNVVDPLAVNEGPCEDDRFRTQFYQKEKHYEHHVERSHASSFPNRGRNHNPLR
jgi:hypothetical protein